MHVATCMQFSTNLQSLKVCSLVDQLFNKLPTILDGLFHKVVDTTSIPVGVEGGGEPWSGGLFQFKNFYMAK